MNNFIGPRGDHIPDALRETQPVKTGKRVTDEVGVTVIRADAFSDD